MPRSTRSLASLAALIAWLAIVVTSFGCGSGHGTGSRPGALILMACNVDGQIGIPLNRRIELVFSEPIDPATVSFETVTFRNRTGAEPVMQ